MDGEWPTCTSPRGDQREKVDDTKVLQGRQVRCPPEELEKPTCMGRGIRRPIKVYWAAFDLEKFFGSHP
jgi:hypothetical protein